jgi:hypothetical protein
MAGDACNGYRFWTPAGEPARAPKKAPARKRKTDPRWTGYAFFQSQSNVWPAVWLE